MEGLLIQFFLIEEAGPDVTQQKERAARKEREEELGRFTAQLSSPAPATNWQNVVLRVISQPVPVAAFREHRVKREARDAALIRLEWLERFALRPLEYQAQRAGAGPEAFDKAQQVGKAKAFFQQVREALEAGEFKLMYLADFTPDGYPRTVDLVEDFNPEGGHQAQGKAAPPAEELTFEGLFLNPADAARTIDAMQEIGIINEAEVYIMGPKRKAALVTVWDVLKRKNLVHIIPDAQAAEILASRFQTTIGRRTAGSTATYTNDLRRELMALL